ncbi:PAS domain-containing protein [Cyanothece sp. BG0011]
MGNLTDLIFLALNRLGQETTYITIIGILSLIIISMLTVIIGLSLQLKHLEKCLQEEIIKRQKTEEKFTAIFNQTIQFIGLLDLEGNLLEVNQTALDYLEIEAKDVIGKPFWETPWWNYSANYQKELKTAIQQAKQGNIIRFETTHLTKNKKKIYLDFSLKPIKDETGKIIFFTS